MKSVLPSAAAVLPFLHGAYAFWRMNCAVIQTGRVDPVVNPGAVAAHAHSIVGGSNIGVNSTYATMVNSSCTSCELRADKSAYWTPLLYYNYPNGSFFEVPHGGSVVYYLARGPNETGIQPFQPGFMMLSGNKAARSYDNETVTWGNAAYPGRPIADRVSFACLVGSGPEPPNQPYIFNATSCVNGLRGQIVFQACWDGINLYKSDNSHVAYLSGIDNGICPPGYEHQLPILFIETNYAVSQVPDAVDDSRFVFSQGDPTGFGFHGDFINGWEMDVQTEAVNTCLYNGAPDGVVQECPVLNSVDTNGYAQNCPEQPPQIGEPVHGLIERLPGCINITYGPEAAPAASMECPSTVAQPSITPTPDSTPLPTASPTPGAQFGLPEQQYLGCYNDTASSGYYRTLNSLAYVNYTVMTVEFCQQYCMDNGYILSGVEYAQECHCDNEINPTTIAAANGTVNECTWNCGGTLTANGVQEFCGGLGYIDVYRNTNSSFDAFGDNTNTAGNAQPYTPAGGFGSNYLGCYSDTPGQPRTLTGPNTAFNNMTIDVCATFCQQGPGYQYYGLEYATQCYCGNDIAPTGLFLTPTTNPTNDTCQMRCRGSEPEVCGGPGALSLYNNTLYVPPVEVPHVGKYGAQACITDPNTNGRPLQGNFTASADMTVEKCIKFCLGSYYHYAGVEYAEECYCGNEIVESSGGVLVPCNATNGMLCAGNDEEYCGGSGFMNLYYSESL
ncbi:hypothetical protein B0A55_06883 [Friedmanniomyces simplex]|uniref:WSC domain-containing protein n=1 Tax=Friedmanniomyces simplex TaxID=329884 RepID=A0A4U0X1U9_9PEZI|nr:hypothetical protein B0A55_06883 [Friedmanniomyces simplex]